MPGQRVRAAVWVWPASVALVSLLVASALLIVRPDPTAGWVRWMWPGDTDTARALLQTVATAVMTASSLTFSITLVGIQLASQQFSPRLLRTFARDRIVQAALALFVSAFVVSLATLRGVNAAEPLPVLGVLLSLLLGFAAAAMLIVFISHMVRRVRVDNMMTAVHHDTVASLEDAYPPYGQRAEAPRDTELPGPGDGVVIRATTSGFVRTIDSDRLVQVAHRDQLFLRIWIRPGDSVIQGTPIGAAFAGAGTAVPVDALTRDVGRAVSFGSERTEEQDVGYGLRQLVDIAVKAISPGINDPTTAAEALSYCTDLLVRLQRRRLGPRVKRDAEGEPRVMLPNRDPRYFLDLVCGQVRRFGRSEPTVLIAVLRLLRDLAVDARDDDQRREIAHQTRLVLEEMSEQLITEDADAVRDLANRVHHALAGDLDAAYQDRAGETRSI